MDFDQTKNQFCSWIRFALKLTVVVTLGWGVLLSCPLVYGQNHELSSPQTDLIMKGLKVYAQEGFRFDFILESPSSSVTSNTLQAETNRLVRYFLAALAVPDDDQWVNLSPFEKDRIIPQAFGTTEMGRDLLAQDYLLKQLAASLTNPESELGKKYWQELGSGQDQKALCKVWIMPAYAKVIEHKDMAVITQSRLKVMMEREYRHDAAGDNHQEAVFRKWVLPVIEKEVNEGKTFALLRQVYHSMIMASWYKRKMHDSFLGQNYVGTNKVLGVELKGPETKEKIYAQYLADFKKGVYATIQEDVDDQTFEVVPRKYFSGGVVAGAAVLAATQFEDVSAAEFSQHASAGVLGKLITAAVRFNPLSKKNVGKALIATTLFGFPLDAQGAQFSATTFPNGYKMFLTYTEPGDTAESIVRKVLELNNSVDREYLQKITPVGEDQYDIWEALIKAGIIDEAGIIQPKFTMYKEYHQFLNDVNKALQQIDADIPYREYEEMNLLGAFVHMQQKLREAVTLSPEAFQRAVESFEQNGQIKKMGEKLVPGQIIDLTSLNEHLVTAVNLKSFPLVTTAEVHQGNNKIKIYFFDTKMNSVFARAQSQDVLVYLQSFADYPEIVKEHMQPDQDPLIQEAYRRAYQHRSDLDIFLSKIRELLFHELTHTETTEIIKRSQSAGDQFYAEAEVSGYLAQIAGSDVPNIPFAETVYMTRNKPPEDFKKFGVASKIIVDQMLKKLKFKDYIAAKRLRPKQNTGTETITGEEYVQLLNQFVLDADPQDIRRAAQEIHRERYGVEIHLTPVEIPPAVIDFAKKNYFHVGSSPVDFTPGGIDMNEKTLNLDVSGSGTPVTVPSDPGQWQTIPFDGLSPVLLHLAPTNLPLLLGEVHPSSRTAKTQLSLSNKF